MLCDGLVMVKIRPLVCIGIICVDNVALLFVNRSHVDGGR